MLDHEDLKWLASQSTDLNRLLQQISRHADQVRQYPARAAFIDLLDDRVALAARKSQEIFERITARILESAASDFPPNDYAGVQTAAASSAATAVTGGPIAMHSNVLVKIPLGEIGGSSGSLPEPVIRNPQGKRELILVVDDDAELLEGTSDMLDFEDYRVVTAKDGPEAIRIYRRLNKQISLVLLDYFLPVMDGDAVFDELKGLNPDVQVVLSSGFGEQAKLGAMLARGLRGFLPKPYTHEKLVDQIRLILDA
jgi:CheY-like chemotaxis protein